MSFQTVFQSSVFSFNEVVGAEGPPQQDGPQRHEHYSELNASERDPVGPRETFALPLTTYKYFNVGSFPE